MATAPPRDVNQQAVAQDASGSPVSAFGQRFSPEAHQALKIIHRLWASGGAVPVLMSRFEMEWEEEWRQDGRDGIPPWQESMERLMRAGLIDHPRDERGRARPNHMLVTGRGEQALEILRDPNRLRRALFDEQRAAQEEADAAMRDHIAEGRRRFLALESLEKCTMAQLRALALEFGIEESQTQAELRASLTSLQAERRRQADESEKRRKG